MHHQLHQKDKFMKTLIRSLASATLVILFATTTTLADTPTSTNPVMKPSGWVVSPQSTFEVFTHKWNGKLVVRVINTAKKPMTVSLLSTDGLELGVGYLGAKDHTQAIQFDVSELSDGEYRVKVENRMETLVKKVELVSPTRPARQAIISVGQ